MMSCLHGTVGYRLRYVLGGELKLKRHTDFDWVESAIYRKSTSGCCFSLGFAMVSWYSKKQTFVALSTKKEKYYAVSVVSREVVWRQKLLTGYLIKI